ISAGMDAAQEFRTVPSWLQESEAWPIVDSNPLQLRAGSELAELWCGVDLQLESRAKFCDFLSPALAGFSAKAAPMPGSAREPQIGGMVQSPFCQTKLQRSLEHSQSVNQASPEVDRRRFREVPGGAGNLSHARSS